MPVIRNAVIKFWMVASLVTGIVIIGEGQSQIPEKVIAQVGTQVILESDIQECYQSTSKYTKNISKCSILKDLIIEKMLRLQAKREAVRVPASTIWENLDKKVQYVCNSAIKGNYEDHKEQTKRELFAAFKDKLVEQKMRELIENRVDITPQEVKKYFQTILPDNLPFIPDQVEVGQIVKILQPTIEEKKVLLQKIKRLRQRILGGEKFEKLAEAYSEDYLYGRSCWETFRPFELSAVAHLKGLKIGEISKVIESTHGYHISQLLGKYDNNGLVRYKYRNIFLSFKSANKNARFIIRRLDSVRKKILDGEAKFGEVAKTFSDDKLSANTGGLLTDSKTNATHIKITNLDSYLFLTLDTMRVGTITPPQSYRLNDGRIAVRIVYYKSKIPGHALNFKQDYDYIRQTALEKKKTQAIENWFHKNKSNFLIKINPKYQSCSLLKK
ncbi:hypothetical protein BKI52_25925 [marine bacterium AO1-C]|nr:hypothetical protein BKI52_25925 [marine bacterium AO1-C]